MDSIRSRPTCTLVQPTCRTPISRYATNSVMTRYGRVTNGLNGTTYVNLPLDVILELMNYLEGAEVACFVCTCRSFLRLSHAHGIWKALCHMQSSYLQYDPFDSLIQNNIYNCNKQEGAYQRLFIKRLKAQEPWKGQVIFSDPSCLFLPWLTSYYVAALPNGNFIMGNNAQCETDRNLYSLERKGRCFLKHIERLSFHQFEDFMALPGGGFIARRISSRDENKMPIWSATGRLVAMCTHARPVICMAVFSNGNIITCSGRKVYIWSSTGQLILTRTRHTENITSIAVLVNDGFVTGSRKGTLIIWSVNYQPIKRVMTSKCIDSLAVLSNGKIVIGHASYLEEENDAAKKLKTRIVTLLNGGFVITDGRRACIRSSTNQLVAILNSEEFRDITRLPSGPIVTLAYGESNVNIWSEEGKLMATLKGHNEEVTSLAVLPSGSILTGSRDSTVRLWEPDIQPLIRANRPWWALNPFRTMSLLPLKVFSRGGLH